MDAGKESDRKENLRAPLHSLSGHGPTYIDGGRQRDWDERLHIFLLAYRISTHETKYTTPSW
jgi:hypothetical protein